MVIERAKSAHLSAQIMRCARKQLGLTQHEVSARLGISQSALSKLEHGTLEPSALQWFEFCKTTGIPTESLLSGTIERNRPALLLEQAQSGSFKVPKGYSRDQGSKVRSVRLFCNYFEHKLGPKRYLQLLEHLGLDPDYLVDLDHQISIEFILDLLEALSEKGALKRKAIAELGQLAGVPEVHGGLSEQYFSRRTSIALLETLLQNARLYECNYSYRVENVQERQLDLSVTPGEHLKKSRAVQDGELAQLLCEFKGQYFQQFAQFGLPGLTRGQKARQSRELDCVRKGASRCIHRIELA